jgi:pyruvate kinase
MKIQTIITLGPATRTLEDLRKLKVRGVDFVRINMSHSTLEDLEYFIGLAKQAGLPFIIDTEGSQVRSGLLRGGIIDLSAGESIWLHEDTHDGTLGDAKRIYLNPREIIGEFEEGDMLYMDFDGVSLSIADTASKREGYITARVIQGGRLGSNKGIGIDPCVPRSFTLPVLSPKDYESIKLGLKHNVGHIAASFMRSGVFVDTVRAATEGKMKIISKIECVDGLENINEIIEKTDFLLIDRGDLSKEVPLEDIPFLQKEIIGKANKKGKGVFVATNLLETMVEKKKPTRAEVHDIIATIEDGAYGLTLAAETAVGKHPIECVNMLNTLIHRAKPESDNPSLIPPHGGSLTERFGTTEDVARANNLPKLSLSTEQAMDVENLATGVFSPLEGFMGKRDVQNVLDIMRLKNGVVWPIPIVLDVSEEAANEYIKGKDIALADKNGELFALLQLAEKSSFDKKELAQKLYGTLSEEHPGVRAVFAMQPVLLGGKVTLLKRIESESAAYSLTPRQVRRIFLERHWSRVVGFHTRNVIHRSHEYIQLEGLRRAGADGLFVHPVVGKKKSGDFNASYILKSYEWMLNGVYPEEKAVLAAFTTYSRYAGPREALFTALCRKNFGCSHFIVGRDHTGVSAFYPPTASHEIFDRFPAKDIGITPIHFGHVFYSEKLGTHVHEHEDTAHSVDEKFHLSGTEARKFFLAGKTPPEWFIRPEISKIILDALNKGEQVFAP